MDVSTKPTGRVTDDGERTTAVFKHAVTEFRRPKFTAFVVIPIILIAMIAGSYYFFRDSSHPLTDKDFILIADFENRTGEEIFDGALKQGLHLQLRQSPFLSIYPDSGVQDTLPLMKREPGARIDRELAREICQRRGLKAFLVGTISKLGGHYVVGIEAIDASTGAMVAVSQAESETKEEVLGALSDAATDMRRQLGESLASITEFDDPLPEVTTSSLEALKAYAMGEEKFTEAMVDKSINERKGARALFQQAVDLDPEFAAAYMRIGDTYDQTGLDQQIENYRKAYELRDKVSEREKIELQEHYYIFLGRDLDKLIEFLKSNVSRYPRDADIRTGIARGYYLKGEMEEAAEAAEEALRIDPGARDALSRLVWSLRSLNREEEARSAILKYRTRPDQYADILFTMALDRNDREAMEANLKILRKTKKTWAVLYETEALAARGEWEKAKALAAPVISHVKEVDSEEFIVLIRQVFLAAQLGMCRDARRLSDRVLSFPKDQLHHMVMRNFGIMMARCGDISRARNLFEDLNGIYPEWPYKYKANVEGYLEAEIDLWRGDGRAALAHIESADNGDYQWFYPRARAYLMLKENEKALAAYQYLLDRPRKYNTSPLYLQPLAQLGKARATGSKAEYEKFFEMWRYADDDIPELVAARKEYLELNSRTTGSARDEAMLSPSANPRPPWSWIF